MEMDVEQQFFVEMSTIHNMECVLTFLSSKDTNKHIQRNGIVLMDRFNFVAVTSLLFLS